MLKDDTTLEENQVLEDNFLVIMLRQVGFFVILVGKWQITDMAWDDKKVIATILTLTVIVH